MAVSYIAEQIQRWFRQGTVLYLATLISNLRCVAQFSLRSSAVSNTAHSESALYKTALIPTKIFSKRCMIQRWFMRTALIWIWFFINYATVSISKYESKKYSINLIQDTQIKNGNFFVLLQLKYESTLYPTAEAYMYKYCTNISKFNSII